MRIFNADGSEAMMCGNASRCIGKYLFERGLTSLTEIRLLTLSGIKILSLLVNDGIVESVTVDMGEPTMWIRWVKRVVRSNSIQPSHSVVTSSLPEWRLTAASAPVCGNVEPASRRLAARGPVPLPLQPF